MLAAGDIGVCQLIDQNHCGAARKNGRRRPFLRKPCLVLNLFSRNGLHLRDEVFDAFAAWLSTTPMVGLVSCE